MGYLSCNAESAIATCDPHNWDLSKKPKKSNKPFKIREFSYSDLESATNGFSATNFLGKGSHGSVYRAAFDGGKLIAAVKKTTNLSNLADSDFKISHADNEIEVLSKIRNPRLVNLLGVGLDSNDLKLIVVEYMPNGSLYEVLHGSTRPPGWRRRVRFALQIAKAVQHLHLSNPPVFHRDIKSSNVLIDGEGSARLGDFGLALRGHVEDVRVSCTPPAGTLGYLDPCYLVPEDLSAKSDVFSFGILLLEMISGRNAIDVDYSPPALVDWAAPLIRSGDYVAICDPRMPPPEDTAAVRRLAVLAGRCVRSTARRRPDMSDVVECLRVVNKRAAAAVWSNLGRRVRKQEPSVSNEPLVSDESARVGVRRNRKLSSVSVVELECRARNDRVARSKSVGSDWKIKSGPSDSNPVRRRGGLAVKMPIVRMSKSRSMGMLQSTIRISFGELDEPKLLMNLEKRGKEKIHEKE